MRRAFGVAVLPAALHGVIGDHIGSPEPLTHREVTPTFEVMGCEPGVRSVRDLFGGVSKRCDNRASIDGCRPRLPLLYWYVILIHDGPRLATLEASPARTSPRVLETSVDGGEFRRDLTVELDTLSSNHGGSCANRGSPRATQMTTKRVVLLR
jgi:hypothetical protein